VWKKKNRGKRGGGKLGRISEEDQGKSDGREKGELASEKTG